MEPGRFFIGFELVLNGFKIDFYIIFYMIFSMIFPIFFLFKGPPGGRRPTVFRMVPIVLHAAPWSSEVHLPGASGLWLFMMIFIVFYCLFIVFLVFSLNHGKKLEI